MYGCFLAGYFPDLINKTGFFFLYFFKRVRMQAKKKF